MKNKVIISMAALVIASMTAAKAQIIISEVDAAGSTSTNGYAADWFELENTGSSSVDITGWKMDDNSDSFSLAVPLTGITSIAAGQAVVFVDNSSGSGTLSPTATATLNANFETAWFGSSVPVGFTIGNYGGSGVGLSQTSDAVNIFNSSSNAVTGVTFGASTLGHTFDNTAGIDGPISTFSSVGVNGAFLSASGYEVGSPGNVAPVPEPSTFAVMGLGAATLLAFRRFRSARK